jgi:hypothetical protein
MQKISFPVAVHSSMYYVDRPELVWSKMKDALGGILKKYNDWVRELDKIEANINGFQTIKCSMEQTAKQILWVFMKKFQAGEARNGKVKFCRTYLAESYGVDYSAPALITIDRHISRFLEMPSSFLKSKERSTLGIPGKDLNCIELELDVSVIVFKDERHNVNLRLGKNVQPKEASGWRKRRQQKLVQQEYDDVRASMVDRSIPVAKQTIEPKMANMETEERSGLPQNIMDIFNQNFKNAFPDA